MFVYLNFFYSKNFQDLFTSMGNKTSDWPPQHDPQLHNCTNSAKNTWWSHNVYEVCTAMQKQPLGEIGYIDSLKNLPGTCRTEVIAIYKQGLLIYMYVYGTKK